MASAIGPDHNAIFQQNALTLSDAKSWEEAALEWTPTWVEPLSDDEENDQSLCKQASHHEIWRIFNTHTRKKALVGRCCLKNFTDNSLFQAKQKILEYVKQLRVDSSKFANMNLIQYALRYKILPANECILYEKIRSKEGILSPQARQFKQQIHERLILQIKNPYPNGISLGQKAQSILYRQYPNQHPVSLANRISDAKGNIESLRVSRKRNNETG